MELWSTRHGSSSEAMLRKAGGEYCILSVTLGNMEQNISLDRKELKDLFNAIGNEIGYWSDVVAEPRQYKALDITQMTPEQWRESYTKYLAQEQVLGVTEIHFDASKIDPENLEWAVSETKRVFGNRVIVEVFRSEQ